jgi:hypothetical protein
MAYLDDFCDNTLTFLRQNIVYVIVAKETSGVIDVVVEPRANTTINGMPAGVANGCVSGGVYKLRTKKPTDPRGLTAYFCPYENNQTKALMLKNAAQWMFTATMDGCTFGVGSQTPGAMGSVRVAHANTSSIASPDRNVQIATPGGVVSGGDAKNRMQALLATSHVGPGGLLIEPPSYMADNLENKATTFGYHQLGGPWTFKALKYRMGGAIWTHAGIVDYPVL